MKRTEAILLLRPGVQPNDLALLDVLLLNCTAYRVDSGKLVYETRDEETRIAVHEALRSGGYVF